MIIDAHTYIDDVTQTKLSKEERDLIFYKNAAKLFNLKL